MIIRPKKASHSNVNRDDDDSESVGVMEVNGQERVQALWVT